MHKLCLLPLMCASFLAFAAPSAASESLSGRYGALTVAVHGGSVHGLFAEGRTGNDSAEAPQFSCLFLLEGRLDGDEASVETWFPGEPERIGGTLRVRSNPSLQLEENHGGCLMTTGDMKAKPYALLQDEHRQDFIGAGLVTADRAILRRKPEDLSTQTHPYLVEFDAVAILEQRPNWVLVEYLRADSLHVTGWLRDSELATTVGAP